MTAARLVKAEYQ